MAEKKNPIMPDGYCEQCSAVSYPLTRALAETGVPTGAENWQGTYGKNKVRALADDHTSLRRLLYALERGDKDAIALEQQRAEGYIAVHAALYRNLSKAAQEAALLAESAPPTTAERDQTLEDGS